MFLSSPKVRMWALLTTAALCTSAAFADGIAATAVYTPSEVSPGVYDYSITLDNTGTTTIGTFWFSWIPGAGFLSATPTDINSPAGWTDTVTNSGAALRWTTTTDLLASDMSLSGFSFESTETPADMAGIFPGPGLGAGDPVATFTVYSGVPLSGPDFIGAALPTPEPASWFLLLSGAALLAFALPSRRSKRPSFTLQPSSSL